MKIDLKLLNLLSNNRPKKKRFRKSRERQSQFLKIRQHNKTITILKEAQTIASRNVSMNQYVQDKENNFSNKLQGLPLQNLENLINSPKTDILYQQRTFSQTKAAQLGSTKNSQKNHKIDSHQQILCPSVKSSQSDKEVQTCLICFANIPDSVLMPCGHGGICSECAKDICRKNGCCYLCRQDIELIYNIDVNNKGKYRKVIAVTQINRSNTKKKNLIPTNNQS